MVDILFIIMVVVTTALLLATFGYAIYLGVLTRRTRAGRIIFGTIGSLKGFVALILLDFYVAILIPEWVATHRQAIRWGLILYLMSQSLGSLIAMERLRRYGN